MKWPKYVVLAIIAMELGHTLALNGQAKTGTYSFFWTAYSWAFVLAMLYFGGFFKERE